MSIMALYKVASVYIRSNRMPRSYDCFQIDEKDSSKEKTLNVTFNTTSHSMEQAIFVLDLTNQLSLWKNPIMNTWIYKDSSNGMTVLVTNDYLNADVYLPFSYEDPVWMIFLSTVLQIILECLLIKEGGVVIHAACIQIGGDVIAFSGDSGIGKSTRAKKMLQTFSGTWLSGDKPLITIDLSGNVIANGVPWDGKEQIFKNIQGKLKTILCIARSTDTVIYPMSNLEQLSFLAKQSFIPIWDPELCAIACSSIKRLIHAVPVLKMDCDRTEESMRVAYTLLQQEVQM